jgi:hypothetical protein
MAGVLSYLFVEAVRQGNYYYVRRKKKKKHGFILELKTKIKVSFSLNELCTACVDLDLKNP